MGAHDRGVDQVPFGVTLARQRFEQQSEHTGRLASEGPAAMVAGLGAAGGKTRL